MDFICEKCTKKLASKQRLIQHQEKCNGLSTLQCPVCQETFKIVTKNTNTKNSLWQRHHQKEKCISSRTSNTL